MSKSSTAKWNLDMSCARAIIGQLTGVLCVLYPDPVGGFLTLNLGNHLRGIQQSGVHISPEAIQVPWRSAEKAHTNCFNLKGLQNVWARELWLSVEYLAPRQNAGLTLFVAAFSRD
jgi:hypothetical protein